MFSDEIVLSITTIPTSSKTMKKRGIKRRKPKLEYRLLCPLVCKYCCRRYPWPYAGFWNHKRKHELKYKPFWSKLTSASNGDVRGDEPEVIRTAEPEVIHKQWFISSPASGDVRGDEPEVIRTEEPEVIRSEGLNVVKQRDSKDEHFSEETQPGAIISMISSSANPYRDNTDDSPVEFSKPSKSKSPAPPKRKYLTIHRSKVCKYCTRRFRDQFWRYQRHVCHHERWYRTHWYKLVHRQKYSRHTCIRSHSIAVTSAGYELSKENKFKQNAHSDRSQSATVRSARSEPSKENEFIKDVDSDSVDSECLPAIGDLLSQQVIKTELQASDEDLEENDLNVITKKDQNRYYLDIEDRLNETRTRRFHEDQANVTPRGITLENVDHATSEQQHRSLHNDQANFTHVGVTLEKDEHDIEQQLGYPTNPILPVHVDRHVAIAVHEDLDDNSIHSDGILKEPSQNDTVFKQLPEKNVSKGHDVETTTKGHRERHSPSDSGDSSKQCYQQMASETHDENNRNDISDSISLPAKIKRKVSKVPKQGRPPRIQCNQLPASETHDETHRNDISDSKSLHTKNKREVLKGPKQRRSPHSNTSKEKRVERTLANIASHSSDGRSDSLKQLTVSLVRMQIEPKFLNAMPVAELQHDSNLENGSTRCSDTNRLRETSDRHDNDSKGDHLGKTKKKKGNLNDYRSGVSEIRSIHHDGNGKDEERRDYEKMQLVDQGKLQDDGDVEERTAKTKDGKRHDKENGNDGDRQQKDMEKRIGRDKQQKPKETDEQSKDKNTRKEGGEKQTTVGKRNCRNTRKEETKERKRNCRYEPREDEKKREEGNDNEDNDNDNEDNENENNDEDLDDHDSNDNDDVTSSDESYKVQDDELDSEDVDDDDDSDEDYDMNETFLKKKKKSNGKRSRKIVIRVTSDDSDDCDDNDDSVVENIPKSKTSDTSKSGIQKGNHSSKQYIYKRANKFIARKSAMKNDSASNATEETRTSGCNQSPSNFRRTEMKRLTTKELAELEENRTKYKHNIPCFKTKRRQHRCTICGKYFAFPHDLKQHVSRHKKPKKFVCKVCGIGFQFPSKLRDHANRHSGKLPYRCRICGKGFADSRNIKSHERFHTGEKPYKCTFCEKSFRLQSALIGHVRYHTGERPYSCGTCGKAFHTQAHRKRHEKTHTGESKMKDKGPSKPRPRIHPCDYCGKMFSTKRGKFNHHLTHTKEKPFACTICGRKFAHVSHRYRHERTVHAGQKNYECSLCGKKFTTNRNKNKHEEFVHAWDDASPDEKLTTSDEELDPASSKRPAVSSPYASTTRTNTKTIPTVNCATSSRENDPPASIITTDSTSKKLYSPQIDPKRRSSIREQSKARRRYHDTVDHVPFSDQHSKHNTKSAHHSRVDESRKNLIEKTNYASSDYDSSSRSVFDQFVSKTNVNIVVQHTCGKQQTFTSTSSLSSHRQQGGSALPTETTTAVDHQQSESVLSRLMSSRTNQGNRHSVETEDRDDVGDTESSISVVESSFSRRTTSRFTPERRDITSALNRLESIQRNAKLIAETLRRGIRGKSIHSDNHEHRAPSPTANQQHSESVPSLESLLQSLQSASESTKSLYSETEHHQTHNKTNRRVEHQRYTKPRTTFQDASKKTCGYETTDSSSIASFTSAEEDTSTQQKSNTARQTKIGHRNSRRSTMAHQNGTRTEQSEPKKKKPWHSKLTPEMQRRLSRQHRKKQFDCRYCSKSFVAEHAWKMHEEDHVRGKRYFCQYCKKGFMTVAGVQRHERIHTGEKNFKCRYCSKRFGNRYDLPAHERIHTGEKPYSCLTCGMCFVDSGSLTNHERTHSSARPYKCDKKGCTSTFKNQGSLRRHDRTIHQGIRYECGFCNISYGRQENLSAHERSQHAGLLPYHCQHCKRRFAEREKYREHLVNRHKAILSN